MTVDVVRVVRVDVPPLVLLSDAAAKSGDGPPLLLGCVYALEGGENDDENGDVVAVTTTFPASNATTDAWDVRTSPAPELVMDAAMEELQRKRGLVVKWYFRRQAVPVAEANDAMAIINDDEQVYQWIAGGGPEAGGGLGRLSDRTVDMTNQTPRADKTTLHRVIRVVRPAYDLTGEYRCQVEDWNSERRSAWHPMVVYSEYLRTVITLISLRLEGRERKRKTKKVYDWIRLMRAVGGCVVDVDNRDQWRFTPLDLK